MEKRRRVSRGKLLCGLFIVGFLCGLCYSVIRGLSPSEEESSDEIGLVVTPLYERALAGCKEKEFTRSASLLGTSMKVLVHTESREKAKESIEAVIRRVQEIERKMSRFNPESELFRLNRTAAKEPFRVSEELFSVIKRSLEFCRLSGGALDITVVPLLNLYKESEKSGTPPTKERITETLKKVGWRKVELDEKEKTVRFGVAGMALDLGATAKGYAVDVALRTLKEHGIEHALVEIGGEVGVYGGQADGSDWTVGIVDPRRSRKYLRIVTMKDGAVATSGNYERYYKVAGKKFSHIIDPRSGEAANAAVSVSLIAKDSFTADALATALSVLGPEDGLALIERLEGVDALILWKDEDGERIVESDGFSEHIKR